MPGVLKTKHKSQADCFSVENPELGINARITEVTALRSKVIFLYQSELHWQISAKIMKC